MKTKLKYNKSDNKANKYKCVFLYDTVKAKKKQPKTYFLKKTPLKKICFFLKKKKNKKKKLKKRNFKKRKFKKKKKTRQT